jgi:NADH-quinone oxidoreductase subunit G
MITPATVKAVIDGLPVEVPRGFTIAQAAEKVHVKIPMLCKHPDLPPTAACGICVVNVKGSRKRPRACCTPLEEGMVIDTQDPDLVAVRRTVIELILSKHPNECFTCLRNGACELQKIAADFGITRQPFANIVPDLPEDNSAKTIVLDPRKCITCGRCIEVCQNVQDVWALSFLDRGFDTRISPAGEISLAESPCVRCGQCSAHCPTGAIHEFDQTQTVWEKLKDPNFHCVVQIAPAVRVAIGEAFGFPPGTNLTGQIYHALRRMGFNGVFDTNFGADLTIMEEATEFVSRFTTGRGAMPLITSCCPAWVDFLEKYWGDVIDCFSTAKSPHQMVGALAKTYYAERKGIDPKTIYSVSIMPCTAKKFEIQRSNEMFGSGFQDVDCTLTTRELARMIKQAGVFFSDLEPQQPDHILAEYTGAAAIFGVTGGVMEAAVRTAYHMITKQDLPDNALEFQAIRGLDGVKEATVEVAGKPVRLAVAHGLGHVNQVMAKIREARKNNQPAPYDFIEVMACPGGCVGGGGQPYGVTDQLRQKRAAGIYEHDRSLAKRRSHQNTHVETLYREYLGRPGSHRAHELLHTSYKARPIYQR